MAVFYSFHYQRDAWRVQMIMNMGVIEGQPLLNSQAWEEVKRQGDRAIENWISDKMAYKSVVVVLVGSQTAGRRWVQYEIRKAWEDRRPMIGVRIHGLEDKTGQDHAGANPFSRIPFTNGGTIADHVPLYEPTGRTGQEVYASIKANLSRWVANGCRRP